MPDRVSVRSRRDRRLIVAVLLLAAFVAIALFAPRPDTEQIRAWAGAESGAPAS